MTRRICRHHPRHFCCARIGLALTRLTLLTLLDPNLTLCWVCLPDNVRLCFGQPCSPCESGRFRRPSPRSAYTYTPSGASPAVIVSLSKVPPGFGPKQSRAWHPREFGAVLGVSASLPLPAPPLPSSSRRYAPQCFVGGYASSPCDVSHRASDEPRRRMSLSSALAPSSLASPSNRRVFLRGFCARRRSVSSLNLARVSPGAKRSRRRRAQCGVQIRRDFVRTIISFLRD